MIYRGPHKPLIITRPCTDSKVCVYIYIYIYIYRVGGENRVGRVTPIKQYFLGLSGSATMCYILWQLGGGDVQILVS